MQKDSKNYLSEIRQKAFASVSERENYYRWLMNYYLTGTDGEEKAEVFNRIFPTINYLTSMIYSGETTKFIVEPVGPVEDESVFEILDVLSDELYEKWQEADIDNIFDDALSWSLVFGSCFLKVVVRKEEYGNTVRVKLVFPSDIGVLREDTNYLDDQRVIVHRYFMSKDEIRNILSLQKKEHLLDEIPFAEQEQDLHSSGLRIILSGWQPGAFAEPRKQETYPPGAGRIYLKEDVVRCYEYWIEQNYDGERDYRVVTATENDIILLDRRNPLIKGIHPFLKITPYPLENYFWGISFTSMLIAAQRIRNKRMAQINSLIERQLRPPVAVTGMTADISDETYKKVFEQGSVMAVLDPSARIQPIVPSIPEGIFEDLGLVDNYFREITAIQEILLGRPERGVRAAAHANIMARLASTPIKKRALKVEDAVEKLATLYLRVLAKFSAERFRAGKLRFLASQLPPFYVKIDSHSSSPVFFEDNLELAITLLQLGIIDKETFIDIVPLPHKKRIKKKFARIAAGLEAQSMQQEEG